MTTGHLEMFNMQSGLHRGVFGKGKGFLLLCRVAIDLQNALIELLFPTSSL